MTPLRLVDPIARAYGGEVFATKQALYAQVKRDLDALEARANRAIGAVLAEMRDYLIAKVRRAGDDLSGLAKSLAFSQRVRADLRRAVAEMLRRAWDMGRRDARAEVRSGRADVKRHDASGAFAPIEALRWLDQKAFWITGVTSDRALADARGVLLEAIRTGRSHREVVDDLKAIFEPYLGKEPGAQAEVVNPWRLETISRTNTTDAYNHGRLTEFLDPDMADTLAAVRYSAVLDERTTEVCRYLDGFLFKPGSPALVELSPPRHFNCRSILVPVVVGEQFNDGDFIGELQVGHAKGLSDPKFLAAHADPWRAYRESTAKEVEP